jgi:hypothetical protein
VLGVAAVATRAGAVSYRELGPVAAGLPQELLSLLGARWDLAGLVFIDPGAGSLRPVLIALDADELDRAVGAWLRGHADCDADGLATALDGKDLRGSWNDDGRLVLLSAMTHQTERQDAGARADHRSGLHHRDRPSAHAAGARWTSPGRW